MGPEGAVSPSIVAIYHFGHSILPEFVKLYSADASFFIAVKYTRYVVPCLSYDRAKEMSKGEALM